MLSMSFDFSETNTNRSGSWNGGGRRTTALITLKTAGLAPMPSASVSTATAVKPGFFSNWRKANLRSFMGCCQRWAKHQKPNTKLQRKSKLQIPSDAAIPWYWSLEIDYSLVFGAWSLVFSFVSQGLHRIDTGRATRGNKTRQGRHRHQYERHQDDREAIVGSETVEQPGHQAPRDRRQDGANAEPRERQLQAAFAEGEQYVVRSRAQRHAHADFVGALSYSAGEHAVQSERRQQQRKQREHA